MTDHAERIKAKLASSASSSRIASLNYHGLRYEMIDEQTALVEDDFVFNLAASHWRSLRDSKCHGYTIAGLIVAIKDRNSEKLSGGRDSIANPADPDKAAELTIDSGCDAESPVSPVTSSLPLVNPWP